MSNTKRTPPIDILLVEDSAGEVELMREALREIKSEAILHVVPDGPTALRFLSKEAPYTEASEPELILLDLNLPGMSGIQVLQWIKGDPRFKSIPVVMLTTSGADKDVVEAYAEHVNCYITKPLSYDSFMEVIRKIEDFWIHTARLPV